MRTALTIAGSDCSGGAGIQADLKTFTMHGVFGMSAITAITVQNTLGVSAVHDVPVEIVAGQLDAVFQDIRPDAVKIGMVASAPCIQVIAQKLRAYGAQNIVLDPVMISTSGCALLPPEAVDALMRDLLPLCDLLTPNLHEAAALYGQPVQTEAQMQRAARTIANDCKGAVLIKGGHLSDSSDDLLYADGRMHWLRGQRVDNPNAHGTGCTLSSAIAAGLALGRPMQQAVRAAKDYVHEALRLGLDLGAGAGPMGLPPGEWGKQ